MLDLGNTVVIPLAFLIHDVLAEAVVPCLEFVVDDLILVETALDVPVTIQA